MNYDDIASRALPAKKVYERSVLFCRQKRVVYKVSKARGQPQIAADRSNREIEITGLIARGHPPRYKYRAAPQVDAHPPSQPLLYLTAA